MDKLGTILMREKRLILFTVLLTVMLCGDMAAAGGHAYLAQYMSLASGPDIFAIALILLTISVLLLVMFFNWWRCRQPPTPDPQPGKMEIKQRMVSASSTSNEGQKNYPQASDQ